MTIRTDISDAYIAIGRNGEDYARFGGDTSGQLAGFRNVLINGGFDIVQRGEYFTTGGYSFDRWFLYNPTNSVVSRIDVGATYGSKALSIYVSNATNIGSIEQPIENDKCRFLAGKKATLSFWCSASASGGTITAAIFKNSTKDSLNTGVWNQIGTKSVSVLGLQKIILTVDIPADGSAEGLMPIISWSNLTSGATSYIWNVQLEEGSIATKFENRPIGIELALCQRYLPAWSALGANQTIATGMCYSTTNAIINLPFKVTPRVSPTGLSYIGGMAILNAGASGVNISSVASFNNASMEVLQMICQVAAGLVAGNSTTLLGTNLTILANGCEL